MPSFEYTLPDTLERIYENQLALEAALMELTLLVESQGHAGHIKQGLARLRAQGRH